MGLVLSIKFIDDSDLGASRAKIIKVKMSQLYHEAIMDSEQVPEGTLYHIAAKQICSGCGTCPNMTANYKEQMESFARKIIAEVLHNDCIRCEGVKITSWEINEFHNPDGTIEFQEMKKKTESII